MARALAFLIIGLVFGGGVGFVLASRSGASDPSQGADHSQHQHVHGEPLDIAPGEGAPTLDIRLSPDPVAGWNLNILTTNFAFAPERSGAAHVDGEGHAHLYVNGEKIARIYGPWFHIDGLTAGEAEVEVTLNANDHRAFVVGGVPVSRSVTLSIPD